MTKEEFEEYQKNREFKEGNFVIFVEELNKNHLAIGEGELGEIIEIVQNEKGENVHKIDFGDEKQVYARRNEIKGCELTEELLLSVGFQATNVDGCYQRGKVNLYDAKRTDKGLFKEGFWIESIVGQDCDDSKRHVIMLNSLQNSLSECYDENLELSSLKGKRSKVHYSNR